MFLNQFFAHLYLQFSFQESIYQMFLDIQMLPLVVCKRFQIRAKINANPIANNPASLSKVELKIIKKKNEKPKRNTLKLFHQLMRLPILSRIP